MGDKVRLFITGVAAVGMVGVTVGGGPSIWHSLMDGDGPHGAVSSRPLTGFDGISVNGPDDVVVTLGSEFAVEKQGDAAVLDRINLYVSKGVLHVTRFRGSGTIFGGNATIHVTLPRLERVWLTGPGDMTVDDVKGKEFRARIDGSGGLAVNHVAADSVALTINGSGHMEMAGSTQSLRVVSTGSGGMNLSGLDAQTADLRINGSGSVQAHASGSAELGVFGSGTAHVSGTTKCEITKRGSGEAECST